MARKKYFPGLGLLVLTCINSFAFEVKEGIDTGSILLHVGGQNITYQNITGVRYDIYRSLISINTSPALLVLSRSKSYFTLIVKDNNLYINCAYFDRRNNYNGARMTTGVCGLDTQLDEAYEEVAHAYPNTLREIVFSFDTSNVIESGAGEDFLLGRIGEIEIYDRYTSSRSVINSSPEKVIKSQYGCYNFKSVVGFLVYKDKRSSLDLEYLDLLRAEEPMKLQRMTEQDLKKLSTDECVGNKNPPG